MAHKIPTGNVKKRRRNTSFDVNPEHEQDWSPDSSPYNEGTVPREPGLPKIDFEFELEDDSKLQSNYVQDCPPLKEKFDDKMFNLKNDFSKRLVSDNVPEYGDEKEKTEEKEEKDTDFRENSTNEDSVPEDFSDQEGEDSDYDDDADYDGNKDRKDVSNEKVITLFIYYFCLYI